MIGVVRCLLVFCLLLTPFLRLSAQAPAGDNAPTVGTIDVRFVGASNVSPAVVRANMQLVEGGPVDEALIDRDIRSLYRTGLFEFIEFKRDAQAGRTVNLVVELTPKYRVQRVVYEGNKHYRDRRLAKETKTRENLALDERQVKEDAEKLRELYQKSGYNQAEVEYTVERNRDTGLGVVTFKIEEGTKVRISKIKFTGNTDVSSNRLRKRMETRKWGIFSWLTDTGKLRDEAFMNDLDKLRDYYRDQGFLDVEIDSDAVRFDYPKENRLVITIPIVQGRRYNIGEITLSGNELHGTDELRSVLRQRSGDIFRPSALDRDVQAIEDFYGKDGYLETRVRMVRKPNLETGAIDVEYAITESDQFHVESIRIEGNTKTKNVVILRELALGPGEVFNTVRMRTSRMRLENTRFFEEVTMTPEPTNIPGRRNLKINVKEGRTGNLTFGAGFSSLDRVVVFAEVTQSNFDLFNRKSLFQGDGQKFRLRLQLGSRSSEAILSFEEPWVFEQELALGFTLYRTSSDYDQQLYEEVRTGAEIYLRKRLIELIEARLAYTYEIVDIRDVDFSAPTYLKNLEGEQSVSKISLKLLRDTRDRLINTSQGNRAELITELAGGPLGADSDYYRIEFRGAQYFSTFDTLNQVLSVIARAGVVESYGDSTEVPYFDRYFLGGPSSLRGFKYRSVGPKDIDVNPMPPASPFPPPFSTTAPTEDPYGGNTFGFLSLEYTFDIVEPLRFAVFYDAGFVNVDAYDFDPGDYNSNFGFGLRLMIAGAPLSLDFGIPLKTDDYNDDGAQFNFSFGTRF